MKLKTALISATFAFGVSSAASADMSDLFASVSTTGAQAGTTGQGSHYISGGTARLRAERANFDIASFNTPSITSGCGGIDIYGGSFGIISKDQLVQTGRAMIQGAASYYFGLALSSICPVCENQMAKLQEMLNKMNQFSRASCAKSTEMISGFIKDQTGTSPEEYFDDVNKASSSFISSNLGFLNSPADAQDNNESEAGTIAGVAKPVADATLMGNAMYQLVAGGRQNVNGNDLNAPVVQGAQSVLFGDSVTDIAEFLMSLTGTTIAFEDNSKPNNFGEGTRSAAFTVKDFVTGVNGSDGLRWYECDAIGSTARSQCINPQPTGAELVPLKTQISNIVSGTSSEDGILVKKLHPDGAKELTDKQKQFVELANINLQGNVMMKKSLSISIEDMNNYLEDVMLYSLVTLVRNELQGLKNKLEEISSEDSNKIQREQSLNRIDEVLDKLKEEQETARAEVKKSFAVIGTIGTVVSAIEKKRQGK
jgi:hypothetical protein